ncbi:MAG: AMP-binding protein [Caulobacter sp.]
MATSFVHSLHERGERTALVTPQGSVSYGRLATMADAIAKQICPSPALVVLEASATAAAVAAYVGCLRAGHSVILTDIGLSKEAWISRYPAHALICVEGGEAVVTHTGAQRPVLHPDLRVLLSTSGSTGSPKLVRLSNANLCANAASIAAYLNLTEDDRAITTLKFSYSYGLSVLNSHLAVGGSLLLSSRSVTEEAFWGQLHDGGANSFAGVPYTFETLHRSGALEHARGLRYVTQAGGRLAPHLIQHFAQLGAQRGWDFFVMYGQTEASPRMAYLPPALASEQPDAIGVAVPGGALYLVDADGAPIHTPGKPGELFYRGPNVMMGYAREANDLATPPGPDILATGDIATFDKDGLYRIVGRTSRFIKLFGLRISLDEVEATARALAPSAHVAGDDNGLAIALEDRDSSAVASLAANLANHLKLPVSCVQVNVWPSPPRLSSGKIDYPAILSAAHLTQPQVSEVHPPGSWLREYLRRTLLQARRILGLGGRWSSVSDLYEAILGTHVHASQTFTDLAGDSLSYVQVSLALEDWLGELPDNWEMLSIEELEGRRLVAAL